MTPDREKLALEAGEDRLREIRERVEKATCGPWSAFNERGIVAVMKGDKEVVNVTGFDGSAFPKAALANADFMAHAREDVPFLLSALAAAQEEAKEMRAWAERLRALLSGGDHELLESEQGWKRRAGAAEAKVSALEARLAVMGEALRKIRELAERNDFTALTALQQAELTARAALEQEGRG